jgi:hypothetical protein
MAPRILGRDPKHTITVERSASDIDEPPFGQTDHGDCPEEDRAHKPR